jgi:hypothetical protein
MPTFEPDPPRRWDQKVGITDVQRDGLCGRTIVSITDVQRDGLCGRTIVSSCERKVGGRSVFWYYSSSPATSQFTADYLVQKFERTKGL